nr:UPF0164 family protein [Treponemataceae bacterium]
MKADKRLFSVLFILFLITLPVFSLEYQEVIQSLSEKFDYLIDSNEGMTTVRTLYVPSGGRSEAMGSAFTALANDVSYMEYNPAAGCNLENSELGLSHNSWISDSSLDSIAYTFRKYNFSFGAQVKCFYVEFIERDMFEDVAKDYYSETIGTLNVSYNFFSGYTFKGLAVGLNLKCGYRDMPNYTDNSSSQIISGSGLLQSGIAFMGDAGIQMRFNLGKFYSDLEPNLNIGIAVSNLGASFTNLGSSDGWQLDDPLASRISAGISYRPIKPLTFAFEFQQPINLFNISNSEKWAIGTGIMVQCTSFFALESGFLLRGGNPRFSLGAEFLVNKYIFNLNYTFDTT